MKPKQIIASNSRKTVRNDKRVEGIICLEGCVNSQGMNDPVNKKDAREEKYCGRVLRLYPAGMNLNILPRMILAWACLLAPVSITLAQLTKLPNPPHSGVAELVSKGEAPLVSDIDVPSGVSLGPTRSAVAVDSKGNLYLGTSSMRGIDVFDRAGHYLRSMAPKYDGTL